ncbi:MAG TPA: archaeosortase/exosortase family protein [Polyangiaceae bacterium]|nr:archaeosortase/exosortase family protein [Polyangiaceae bacterium]
MLFGVLAVTSLGLYYYPYPEGSAARSWLDAYLRGYAAVSGSILRCFDATLIVQGQNLTGRFSLRIVKTCDAMDVQILFVSAVLAWPGPWLRRLVAGALGAAVILVANILRICSLYFVGLYVPDWFEFVHVELWPAVLLVLATGMFVALALGDARPYSPATQS